MVCNSFQWLQCSSTGSVGTGKPHRPYEEHKDRGAENMWLALVWAPLLTFNFKWYDLPPEIQCNHQGIISRMSGASLPLFEIVA